MRERPVSYTAYLLRVWHVRELRDAWRASLENAQTHELRGFASLEEVFEFLSQEVVRQRESEVDGKTGDLSLKED